MNKTNSNYYASNFNFELIPPPNTLDKQIYSKPPNFNSLFSQDLLSLQDILEMNNINLENYKNGKAEIIYSEEPYFGNRNIYLDELIDYLNLREPYNKENYKKFQYINYNKNNNILFSSNIESGNLRMVIKHSDNEYDLITRPETNSIKAYQWFYFIVKPNENYFSSKNTIIKFNIINLYKKSIIFNDQIHVLCHYNNYWTRDTTDIFYFQNNFPITNDILNSNNNINSNQNSLNFNTLNTNMNLNFNTNSFLNNINNNNNNNNNNNQNYFHTLTFSFDFKKIETPIKYVYFSYCYPYPYSTLINFISSLNKFTNYLRYEEIGKTLNGNILHMLVITNFSDTFENLAKKQSIILTGRVHPGESNSSYVIQGLIEYLLSNNNIAYKLRKNFIFKIIPMLNPDGVIRGNYRMNLIGKDLNRMWTDPDIKTCPTIFYSHQMIQKTLNSRDIYLFCDFHGHSNKQNFFLYSCKSKNENLHLKDSKKFSYHELVFPNIFSKENIYFDKKACVDKINPSKLKTARAVLKMRYNIDLSYCLESSTGAIKLPNGFLKPFNIELYKKIGKDFCITLSKLINSKIYFSVLNSVRCEKREKEKEKEKDMKKNKENVLPIISHKISINNGNSNITRNKSEGSIRGRGKKISFSINNNNNNGENVLIKKQYSNVIEKMYNFH